MDGYRSFNELKLHEKEGVDFKIKFKRRQSSGIAVMAIHGGGIEPGTTEIAEAIAGDRYTFYSFCGIKPFHNVGLHITSRRFDEPVGLSLARSSSTVITIHGCGDSVPMVYLGGRNASLKGHVFTSLKEAGFSIRQSVRFPGISPMNICNRCRLRQGVQIEIAKGLRQKMFHSLMRLHRDETSLWFDRFVNAVRLSMQAWLKIK